MKHSDEARSTYGTGHKYDLRQAALANLSAPHIGVLEVYRGDEDDDPQQYIFNGDAAHYETSVHQAETFMREHHNCGPADMTWELYLDVGFARDPISLVPITTMEPGGHIVFTSKGPMAGYYIGEEFIVDNGYEKQR